MPTITGTWRNGTRGNWKLTIPVRVTGYNGTEILPAGVYASGDLAADPPTLSVTVPSSVNTLPADWQPVLEVVIYNGDDEIYTLDVSGTAAIDLSTYTLPTGTVPPDAATLLTQAIALEIARAEAAEATERTRAVTAEGVNATAISSEASTARAAELALRNLSDPTFAAGLSASFVGKDGNVWDALDHGVKADTIELTDVRVTAGSADLYAPGASFTAADIGKLIAIMGAGTGGGGLTSSSNPITAVADSQHATMTKLAVTSTVAPRSVTDATMAIDSQTLTSATAAFTAGDIGKSVVITGAGESGRYILTDKGTVSGTTLSAQYAIFPASLVGKSVSIAGAGASSATHTTTVTAVAGDNLSCTLAAAAPSSLTGWAFVQAWDVVDLSTVITVFTNSTTVGLRRRATQPVSGAACTISGHSAVYGTDDLAAWQALTTAVQSGDVITLRRGRVSFLGQGTWTIDKTVNFEFGDRTAALHYGLTSGRIKPAAHNVAWRKAQFRALQSNATCSMFGASALGVGCREWRFDNCRWDGVRANFERVNALQSLGTLNTSASDFEGPVTLTRPEMTGVMGEGALYVYGTRDVHVINPWVHDNGQSPSAGDQIKVAAGATGFQIHGGVTEWGARDGIDIFDAVGAVIMGLESRHNQVNGLEAKWESNQNFNAPGRHSIKMRCWNNGIGAQVGTHYTNVEILALGNRSYGLRCGADAATNTLANATFGMNIGPCVALGNAGVGIILTNLKNANADNLQAHGNAVDGIQVLGDTITVENYQAFGNTTHGLEVVAGSNLITLRGHSQDADGVAYINAGSTGIAVNGYGEEAAGTGNTPTAGVWRLGVVVRNTSDATTWRRIAGGWRQTDVAGGGTPTAHATSHNIGGSDALTFPARVLATSTPTISPGTVNTTTETNIFSMTVPAAQVAAGDVVLFEGAFDYLNNSGSASTLTLRVKLGATTVLTSGAVSLAASAVRYNYTVRVSMILATTADERFAINFFASNASTARVLVSAPSLAASGTAVEDLTSDKTLVITGQMGNAASTIDFRPTGGVLYRMR